MKIALLVLFIFCFSRLTFSQIYTPQVDSIVMRDGKKLAADIYIPTGGLQRPTILIQTPYNRIFYRFGLPLGIDANLNLSGYNFVIVDWRGFYGSSGALAGTPNRGQDGYDIVEWIAQQTWSDGKIGTWGPSALGKIQYQTAKENPPHLTCCVPLVAGSQFEYSEYYPGGVYRTEYVQQLDALGYGMSVGILANPFYNLTWQYLQNTNFYPQLINVPCFMIGGWYDHNIDLMMNLFAGIRQSSPVTVRGKHKLLMGPWAHGGFGQAQVGTCNQGELTFNEACGWSDSLALRFLDYYLKNQPNGWDSEPIIRYFNIGENIWNSTTTWPPTGNTNQNFYLNETGVLSNLAPVLTNSYSQYIYNPSNPSPTHGGTTLRQDLLQGPYDQSVVVESRNDLAIFTSAVLSSPVKISGKPTAHLYIKSDRKDTDFTIRLCDVYPDGRSILISDGILRMRFRNGYSTADTSSIIPNQIYEAQIDFPNTAYTFLTGHSIRIDVSSSNYPKYDRNLNNGFTMYVAGDTLTATNKILHEASHSSYLSLPISNANNISEEKQENLINIFPNPASDRFRINIDNNVQQFNVKILNLVGDELVNTNVINGNSIEVLNITDGIYIIQVFDNKKYVGSSKITILK
ncbi:MAG: CocE/NonD family hydrolase [Bacteroidia bacterium]|nr:CocE/NonD family hydrolase [Bacteroidia bacterium]